MDGWISMGRMEILGRVIPFESRAYPGLRPSLYDCVVLCSFDCINFTALELLKFFEIKNNSKLQ
jgi:hypothetical protein